MSEIKINETLTYPLQTAAELVQSLSESDRDSFIDHLYDNYANAMRRNKMVNRQPLSKESFENHFFNGGNHEESVAFGNQESGFILGSRLKEGLFVPSHFAPETARGGVRLIRELVKVKEPTALLVTDDLVKMLVKVGGWKVLPFKTQVDFHGTLVEKQLAVNQWKTIPLLLEHYVTQKVRQRLNTVSPHVNPWIQKLGEKVKAIMNKADANVDEYTSYAARETDQTPQDELLPRISTDDPRLKRLFMDNDDDLSA